MASGLFGFVAFSARTRPIFGVLWAAEERCRAEPLDFYAQWMGYHYGVVFSPYSCD